MIEKYLNHRFIRNNSINGIYCFINPAGEKVFRIVSVENKKGSLSFELLGECKGTVSEIKQQIKLNTPIYLVLDGKGILLKKATIDPDVSLIKQLIPTAGEDEFVVDSYPGDNGSVHVALARKELADDIINQFQQEGMNIIGLSLGPFRVVNILNYFDELKPIVTFESCKIQFSRDDQAITSFEKSESNDNFHKYTIDSKEVPSEYLPALSAAFGYYIEADQEYEYHVVKELKREYLSKILLQKASIGVLVTAFILLFFNMLLYMHYSEKKQVLENQLMGNKNILSVLDTLKKEVEWKEKFMRETGISKNVKMSFYADRIAQSVPEDISLEKLEIHPVIGKVRSNKEITIKPNTILIEGIAKNSALLNNWVHILKEKEWVGNVGIINYSPENETFLGYFSLELGINSLTNSKK